jgi:hypothetical protein
MKLPTFRRRRTPIKHNHMLLYPGRTILVQCTGESCPYCGLPKLDVRGDPC